MRLAAALLLSAAIATPALSQVTRFEVTEDVPAFGGRTFG